MSETGHSNDESLVSDAFLRDSEVQLKKAAAVIEHCIDQLTDDQLAWRSHESANSIGNLVLHLCGNVRQWIIAGVGRAEDIRQRPDEFAARGPFVASELKEQLRQTLAQAFDTLQTITADQLLESCRIQGFSTNALSAIFDSTVHFKGHTQEIVCLTRMLLGTDYQFNWAPSTPEEGA